MSEAYAEWRQERLELIRARFHELKAADKMLDKIIPALASERHYILLVQKVLADEGIRAVVEYRGGNYYLEIRGRRYPWPPESSWDMPQRLTIAP